MIKRKKKKCKGVCGEMKYLYAQGRCLNCDKIENPQKYGIKRNTDTTKPQKRKRIQPFSKKKLEQMRIYRPLRDKYMKDHPICEWDGCNKLANDLHHMKPRATHLCDVTVFMAICRPHHTWIDNNHKESVSLGYLYQAIPK